MPAAPALESPSLPAWAPMFDPLPVPSARSPYDPHSTGMADDADLDIPLLDTPIAPALFIDSAPAIATLAQPQAIPPAAPSFSARDWEQLQAEITERITGQLLGRIDFMLEQRVRDSLADVLQVAVEGLAQEIRRGLHQTVEDVIARAVAQEIAYLQIPKY
ncbi:MAG: hypothetical protein M3N23_08220 [Pseudomonadota bacterium]|nr:hypothetical protein [Pseudomonadota bacterium]